jgi:hypothetical protein
MRRIQTVVDKVDLPCWDALVARQMINQETAIDDYAVG